MDAQRDHRALESRVRHSRHRQEQLAGQKWRLGFHAITMASPAAPGKT
jgi:hypothetical protein